MDVVQLIREVARTDRFLRYEMRSDRSSAARTLISLTVPERDIPAVLRLLADPDPAVRFWTIGAVRRVPESHVLPHLPAFLPLLADPDESVRLEAHHFIWHRGMRALSALRELSRTPGPHRRYALNALAEVVGWSGLDHADQALVRRLIRIKAPREEPAPFQPNGQWYALPTTDQAAVLDALDLSDPMPVTVRLGQAAASGYYTQCGRVCYVTPGLDGWTLAFTGPRNLGGNVVALSRRFGVAHAYSTWDDGCNFTDEWCIAERGTVIRSYSYSTGDELEDGDPLPVEQGHILPHQYEDRPGVPPVCGPLTVAAAMSVAPTAIGPHTRVVGRAVMALTAKGRELGVQPGTLPI